MLIPEPEAEPEAEAAKLVAIPESAGGDVPLEAPKVERGLLARLMLGRLPAK